LKVPFNLPARENGWYREELCEAINHVLDSGYYLLGEHVDAFENEFSRACGADYCISVGNGTDALEIALRALGVGHGDEVMTVANAGGYATTACNLMGAFPVYVDVNEDDLLMNIAQAAEAASLKTKCIIATHLYGQPVDVPKLRNLLDISGCGHVKILEDCAQAHGASLAGKPVGSLGDAAAFSFYPTKNLGALGDGGAIVTSVREIADQCFQLRQYGWESKYNARIPYGRNSRMDEIQAAVLLVKLAHLSELNDRRRAVAEKLCHACGDYVDIVTLPAPGSVAHLFVVRHKYRDKIRAELTRCGIASDIHYPVLDMNQPSMQHLNFRVLDVTHAEQATQEIFSLPCYAGIKDAELEYIRQVFETNISGIVGEQV